MKLSITESRLRKIIVEEINVFLTEKTENPIPPKVILFFKDFAKKSGMNSSDLFKALTNFNVKSTLPTQSTKASTDATKDVQSTSSTTSSSATQGTIATQPTNSAIKSTSDLGKIENALSKQQLSDLAKPMLQMATAGKTGNSNVVQELPKLVRLIRQELQRHNTEMEKKIKQDDKK